MPGNGAPAGAGARRALAVLLLLAVGVIGLRAGNSFSAAGSQSVVTTLGDVLYWVFFVAAGMLLVFDVALLFLWLSGRRGRRAKQAPAARRRPLLAVLIVLAELFVIVKVLALIRQHEQHVTSGPATRRALPPAGGTHGLVPSAASWPLLVGLGVAVVAAAILVSTARQRRATLAARAGPEAEPEPAPAPEPLAAALAAGEDALRDDPDPRNAIIGCYRAMEHAMSQAGAPPSQADTPAEVLTRASGLVRSGAAVTLTTLFRRARYSSHTMTEADRSAAHGALGQLREDLAGEPAGHGTHLPGETA